TNDAPERSRHSVILALSQETLSNLDLPTRYFTGVRSGPGAALIDHARCLLRFRNPCASEHHDRVGDIVIPQQILRFQVFELKAHASRCRLAQKIQILSGFAIARARENVSDSIWGGGIIARRFDGLSRKRLVALCWMRW